MVTLSSFRFGYERFFGVCGSQCLRTLHKRTKGAILLRKAGGQHGSKTLVRRVPPVIVIKVPTVMTVAVRPPITVSYGPFHNHRASVNDYWPHYHDPFLNDDGSLNYDGSFNDQGSFHHGWTIIVVVSIVSIVARRAEVACQRRHRCQ
jgi:hypothetical protein